MTYRSNSGIMSDMLHVGSCRFSDGTPHHLHHTPQDRGSLSLHVVRGRNADTGSEIIGVNFKVKQIGR